MNLFVKCERLLCDSKMPWLREQTTNWEFSVYNSWKHPESCQRPIRELCGKYIKSKILIVSCFQVQYVLDLKEMDLIKLRIAHALSEKAVELSKQKFSSNVIEKVPIHAII